jgi:hypothetical protein
MRTRLSSSGGHVRRRTPPSASFATLLVRQGGAGGRRRLSCPTLQRRGRVAAFLARWSSAPRRGLSAGALPGTSAAASRQRTRQRCSAKAHFDREIASGLLRYASMGGKPTPHHG